MGVEERRVPVIRPPGRQRNRLAEHPTRSIRTGQVLADAVAFLIADHRPEEFMEIRPTAFAALFSILTFSSVLAADPPVIVDGTSHLSALTTAWAAAAPQANFVLSVANGESGGGAGFVRFAAGHSHVQKSVRPMLESEQRTCAANGIQFLEVLAAHGPLGNESLRLFVNTAALERESVRDYLKFCFSDVGQELAREHAAPLTAAELQASRQRILKAIEEHAVGGE